jgi:DNA-binding transcriptional LysR family regulator
MVRLAVGVAIGLRWVIPLLPAFLKAHPEITVELHLSDEKTDLVAEGFDTALRATSRLDEGLVARKRCPFSQVIVAAPDYLARHRCPHHPHDLTHTDCLGCVQRARPDLWRLRNPAGEGVKVSPRGPLRATAVEALVPAVLQGLGFAALPDFIAAQHLRAGRMEALLTDWYFPGATFTS